MAGVGRLGLNLGLALAGGVLAIAWAGPAQALLTSVQEPYGLFTEPGQTTEAVFGSVFLAGTTDGVGQGVGIDMFLRLGLPDVAGGFLSFTDIPMAYVMDDGLSDVYSATITPSVVGVFSYVVVGVDTVNLTTAISPEGGILQVATPEPGSLAVLGVALAGLVARRRVVSRG